MTIFAKLNYKNNIMKHNFIQCIIIGLLIFSSNIIFSQPIFVGHRGSLWGVENTSEAFINGALKGYQYLECDIKVAGDGTIVVTHDDTTKRLGGSLTINKSTLEELKSETYTQTRDGVKYIGKICTLAEYLDICTQYNVVPVIELKWSTGINNNDQSGMPALVKLIEEKGFRNKCVILTSMKPCLEYLRKNYPDIELQLLVRLHTKEHLTWCKKWKIDADIHYASVTKKTIKKYHNNGLKVNVWTVNNDTIFNNLAKMGCDFITTDKLTLQDYK